MKAKKKVISIPEWLIIAGIIYTTILFAVYKFHFKYSKMDINIYQQLREVPYAKVFFLYVLIFLTLGIIYFLIRKVKNIEVNYLLVGLQVFLIVFSASIYLTRMNVIVEKALDLVVISRTQIYFPFHNNFDLIWSSPSPLGKAVIIFAAAGIILFPLIVGFSFIRKR